MPDQKEHDKIENLVEAHKPPGAAPDKRGTAADLAAAGESVVRGSSNTPGEAAHSARTLEEAAASNQTLQGFQAINNERIPEDLENEGLTSTAKK